MTQFLITISALLIGTLAGGVFLVLYMVKVPGWWHEEHRVHVVSFSAVMWAFYALSTYRLLTGTTAGWFNITRMVLFLALTGIIVWRLFIFLRGLRRRRVTEKS